MTSKLRGAIRQSINYVMRFEVGGGRGVHCLIKVSNYFNYELLQRVLFSIATSRCLNVVFHQKQKRWYLTCLVKHWNTGGG